MIANTMPPMAMMIVHLRPSAMNLMLSLIHSRSKPAAMQKNPSTVKMTTQTAATFSRNGMRALAQGQPLHPRLVAHC